MSSFEPVAESREDRLGREHVDSRCGQLDGKRQPIQPPADLLDGLAAVRGEREAREHRTCPRREERNSVVKDHRLRGHHVLNREAHRLPAGEQHPHAEGCGEELRQLGSRYRDLLDVVDDQQQPARRKVGGQRLAGALADAQCFRDRGQHERCLSDRGHGHVEHAIVKVVEHVMRDLQRKPSLARSPGSGQRDHPHAIA